MPYDLSATVHHKPTKGGSGHYTAISRSRDLQSQKWFMYDDDRVSSSKFTNMHKKHTMVKKSYMKTATILFYASPSIETRINNAKTIDLMEGGKDQTQVVPVQTNSEINRCYNGVKDSIDIDGDGKEGNADGSSGDVPVQTNLEMNRCYNGIKDSVDIDRDGEEGNADGSSRDVPVQTESEMNPSYNGVKDSVDIDVDGEEGNADGSSDENDNKDDEEEEEGESGKVDSSSGEESSGSSDSSSTTDSSDSSTDSSDSS